MKNEMLKLIEGRCDRTDIYTKYGKLRRTV